MRYLQVVCLVLVVFALTGFKHFKLDPPDVKALPGIIDALNKSTPDNPTRVLMVHGMGTQRPDWPKTLETNLAQQLGVTKDSDCTRITIVNDPKHPPVDAVNAALEQCKYTDQARKRSLIFYELTWSPLTEKVKSRVLGYDHRDYGSGRAEDNRNLKREIVNDGLADPVLYIGHYRPILQYPIKQVICIVLQGPPPSGSPCSFDKDKLSKLQNLQFIIITKSLGSAMLYDTLKGMQQSGGQQKKGRLPESFNLEAKAATTFKANTVRIYMLANQLPLLCLGRYSKQDQVCEEPMEAKLIPPMLPTEIQIVAISDPNDLFSYPLKDWQLSLVGLEGSPVNVLVNMAGCAVAFFYCDMRKPEQAHNGHDADKTVIQLMACGLEAGRVQKCK